MRAVWAKKWTNQILCIVFLYPLYPLFPSFHIHPPPRQLSAAIPFAYQVSSVATLVVLARTKDLRFFRSSQIILIMLLPFLLQLSLGGYVASSAVILWALVGALGALAVASVALRDCFTPEALDTLVDVAYDALGHPPTH